MIRSFGSRALKRFWEKGDSKGVKPQFLPRISRMLSALNLAGHPGEMNVPGWGFHPLTGGRKGTYALTVSGNWRLTFRWDGADAVDVNLEDYH
ncbi:MAG: type II toxin-antitoxin system RelE/ParE family toxin [Alphaproteobacteria bacterium]